MATETWILVLVAGFFVLETSFGQASGALVVDVDGDGENDLVFTSYEANAVNVYAHK